MINKGKYFSSYFFALLISVQLILPPVVFGEERASFSFRERIKKKIISKLKTKLENEPAPTLNDWPSKTTPKPGTYVRLIQHQKLPRYYKIYIPTHYDGVKAMPLLFAFHGGAGSMSIMGNDEYYHLISKSEIENFIVVFPNGASQFPSGKVATWNAGNCCSWARDSKSDDVGFIKELVNLLKTELKIDDRKIFAIGMSNGGMFSYRLACELSETFTAIAAVAGTDNTKSCTPIRPISILHIHAKDDDHVLYQGGIGPKGAKENQVTPFTSVSETIAKWLKINQCDERSKKVLTIQGATCELYSTCKNNVQVKLCTSETGGHSWPGGTKPLNQKKSESALSANDLIWEFFNTI